MGETQLSFDCEVLRLFGINDFTEFAGGEIHYLFSQDIFLYWVIVVDGKVMGVTPTDRSELDGFEGGEEVTDKEYATHLIDARVLDTPEYKSKLQEIIYYKQKKFGFN